MKTLTDGERDILDELNADAMTAGRPRNGRTT